MSAPTLARPPACDDVLSLLQGHVDELRATARSLAKAATVNEDRIDRDLATDLRTLAFRVLDEIYEVTCSNEDCTAVARPHGFDGRLCDVHAYLDLEQRR